jgi:glycosyltransferase involved in cell wall biosynthesis
VRFVGWHDDVSFFFVNADAFLSLSNYEGYGRSLVEAALRALPIVTTDVGVVGELLRPDQEALVVDADPEMVAAAIERVMEDGAFARQLGEAAKARALEQAMTEDEYLARYREAMHTCIP